MYRLEYATYLGFLSDGSPLTTGRDDKKSLSCPTCVIGHPSWVSFGWIPATNRGYDGRGCHSRHVLSGIHLSCISDGSPLTTGGDDKKSRSCPACVIGHPSWVSFGGIPATNRGYDRRGDRYPLTTGRDDRWGIFALDYILKFI